MGGSGLPIALMEFFENALDISVGKLPPNQVAGEAKLGDTKAQVEERRHLFPAGIRETAQRETTACGERDRRAPTAVDEDARHVTNAYPFNAPGYLARTGFMTPIAV